MLHLIHHYRNVRLPSDPHSHHPIVFPSLQTLQTTTYTTTTIEYDPTATSHTMPPLQDTTSEESETGVDEHQLIHLHQMDLIHHPSRMLTDPTMGEHDALDSY